MNGLDRYRMRRILSLTGDVLVTENLKPLQALVQEVLHLAAENMSEEELLPLLNYGVDSGDYELVWKQREAA